SCFKPAPFLFWSAPFLFQTGLSGAGPTPGGMEPAPSVAGDSYGGKLHAPANQCFTAPPQRGQPAGAAEAGGSAEKRPRATVPSRRPGSPAAPASQSRLARSKTSPAPEASPQARRARLTCAPA